MTPSDPLIGTQLAGKYTVASLSHEELLGRVYVARDVGLDRLVHLKVLHPHFADDPKKFERFGREITASFMVSHPNTVEVLDFGEERGALYLVLEYLCSEPLSKTLLQGPMDPERVARIAAQVATAIGAAHQEGILHRHLCPDNVLLLQNVAQGDYVKVRDFGMAKLEEEGTESGLTTSNTQVGLAAYSPPEFIRSGSFHLKGDIYALGALMWHMLAGRPPFEGGIEQILAAQMSSVPDSPSVARGEPLPEWLEALVADMLAKEPSDRPGAYKVVQRLEAGLDGGLEPPALLPLDREGAFVLPTKAIAGEAPVGRAVMIAGGVGLVLVMTAMIGVLVVGVALTIVLLTLPQ